MVRASGLGPVLPAGSRTPCFRPFGCREPLAVTAPCDARQLIIFRPLVLDRAVVGFVQHPAEPLGQLLIRRQDDQILAVRRDLDQPLQRVVAPRALLFVLDQVEDLVPMLLPEASPQGDPSPRIFDLDLPAARATYRGPV